MPQVREDPVREGSHPEKKRPSPSHVDEDEEWLTRLGEVETAGWCGGERVWDPLRLIPSGNTRGVMVASPSPFPIE